MIEQTLSIIKPDAVERNLEDKIISFFAKNNLTVLLLQATTYSPVEIIT